MHVSWCYTCKKVWIVIFLNSRQGGRIPTSQAGFVNVFEWHPTQQFWQARVVCPARRIESVVLDEGLWWLKLWRCGRRWQTQLQTWRVGLAGVKEKLLSDIEEFLGEDTRKWYKDMMTWYDVTFSFCLHTWRHMYTCIMSPMWKLMCYSHLFSSNRLGTWHPTQEGLSLLWCAGFGQDFATELSSFNDFERLDAAMSRRCLQICFPPWGWYRLLLVTSNITFVICIWHIPIWRMRAWELQWTKRRGIRSSDSKNKD